MGLKEEIDARRATIHTDSYPMSIGELLNLYRDGELDIHPEFQRFFRWTDQQKSRLIESLLLGIPLPSIFVAQRKDGVWDVIDGLQRLATIFEFVGVLRDEADAPVPPLVLTGTRYLPSMNGKVWGSDDDDEQPNAIAREHQLIIKRSRIDVTIIQRESDESSKYELFQRLNTGGSPLSDQELRNCILITIDRSFYGWLTELRRDEAFRSCIAITDRLFEEQYDLELVVRFLAMRTAPDETLRNIGDIGEFLTDRMVAVAQDASYSREDEGQAFLATFRVLADSLADDSFRRFDAQKQRFQGGFLISAFEVVALGIGWNCASYGGGDNAQLVVDTVQRLWSNPRFTERIGSGLRASQRIPHTIPLGRTLFAR